MAAFTLATGLMQSNVTGLKWQDINLEKKHALVNPEDSKTNQTIPVPLNQKTLAILKSCKGKQTNHAFTYKGNP